MTTQTDWQQLDIQIPGIPPAFSSKEEAEKTVVEMNRLLKKEYQKILDYAVKKELVSSRQQKDYQKELDQLTIYQVASTVADEKRLNELNIRYFELAKRFFELHQKKLDTGCDEYELDYIGASDFYKLFHESPESRRRRLEGPINRKIEKNERETERINEEIERLQQEKRYKIFIDEENPMSSPQAFYERILSEQI